MLAMVVLSLLSLVILSLISGSRTSSDHLILNPYKSQHHRIVTNTSEHAKRQAATNGQFDFFVPGYAVPVISTVAINNKVYFLDKKYDPGNTTGAYELDPSLVGAGPWENAWRSLQVQDEILCSASLVLPDKAGRILNIGGWSDAALFGVRLFTPGDANENLNWEEDEGVVLLQKPRWYPTAMTMANGSVLIMGGEDTNSGNEQPNLEVLPRVPGGDTTVYLQFLADTYPFNLFPFLFVLPSKNIFVIYYNQARILDATTFATISTLPMVPGSTAGDFNAGRTYPYSGAAAILPQKAPYTDPLTVVVCGGATQDQVGLDTCVSISPEVGGAQWTVENMPSTRVLSCMVALPDGTFLILNGAHFGVAGFGGSHDPNFVPVLYDPTLPVGQRMRELASTNIARLYHSEAALLADGRVIVSGSDPRDSNYPQEYRHEMFSPPYLFNGGIRPAFQVGNKQWVYGGKYAVKVKSPSMANITFSLVGANSNTHGNIMGGRTIFPQFTCIGKACIITAPPDAGVCPPSWFLLFVLNGPTPSKGVWVRIGGDPAQLGNWPPGPSFTRPGV